VLRGKRVGCAECDVGTSRLEGGHEIGGFRRDVQARGDALAGQWLLLLEARANLPEHLHGALGPLGAPLSVVGEGNVPDVARHVTACSRYRCHPSTSRM